MDVSNVDDLGSLVSAFGKPTAVILLVGYFLAKNGFLRVILRDDRKDDIAKLSETIDTIVKDMAHIKEDLAVLKDRWDRK